MNDFATKMAAAAAQVDALLDQLLAAPADAVEADHRVYDAMRHSVMAGGKRLRPFLVMSSADLAGADPTGALRVAAAIELIHSYSLVHDDLPAMDDDDLRRGQPTVHIAFDEATAILAGDGLLTRAFEVVADPATHQDGNIRAAVMLEMARAAGVDGMVGGQMRDLAAETAPLTDAAAVLALQARKTGALIRFSCLAGGLLGQSNNNEINALDTYGQNLGLIFQITDDLLDVEGDEALMGKAVGKDADRGKGTLVGLMGAEKARKMAEELGRGGNDALQIFGTKSELLQSVTRFVLDRRH